MVVLQAAHLHRGDTEHANGEDKHRDEYLNQRKTGDAFEPGAAM
jgi:hypothetical protein